MKKPWQIMLSSSGLTLEVVDAHAPKEALDVYAVRELSRRGVELTNDCSPWMQLCRTNGCSAKYTVADGFRIFI